MALSQSDRIGAILLEMSKLNGQSIGIGNLIHCTAQTFYDDAAIAGDVSDLASRRWADDVVK